MLTTGASDNSFRMRPRPCTRPRRRSSRASCWRPPFRAPPAPRTSSSWRPTFQVRRSASCSPVSSSTLHSRSDMPRSLAANAGRQRRCSCAKFAARQQPRRRLAPCGSCPVCFIAPLAGRCPSRSQRSPRSPMPSSTAPPSAVGRRPTAPRRRRVPPGSAAIAMQGCPQPSPKPPVPATPTTRLASAPSATAKPMTRLRLPRRRAP
mmetsp:Transcript_50137/g.145703  ORF Transcript_50137/g.145703 Transcript_50137/m.145703 type:complete len:206 (+) Transcript_50137:121-738(+)